MTDNSIFNSAMMRSSAAAAAAAKTNETSTAAQSGTTLQGSGNDSLGFQDFLKLIVAQMQNQDMMNPMNDTEFIGQMAQMAVMQAVNQMSEISVTQYGVSLLGKEVTAAVMGDSGLKTTIGVVTGVSLFEGQPVVYIGKEAFALGSIMAAGRLPEKEPEAEEPEGDTGDPGGSGGESGGDGESEAV